MTNCPNCGHKINPAQLLAQAGVAKRKKDPKFNEKMRALVEKRWSKKDNK